MAKHLISTVGVYYTKIIPTRSAKTRAGGRSIMMELEVIINPSHHMKKKLNKRIGTNKQAPSTHQSTTSTNADRCAGRQLGRKIACPSCGCMGRQVEARFVSFPMANSPLLAPFD
ncbi:unnamed protein product [Linum trigynum]|uniref:Uncharacterized protein n=1 Tax=Linum trigynum TaxID=586398 RepID=A0AAV2E2F9_9ROSI